MIAGRPFALIDPHWRARTPRVRLEDKGSRASVTGEHSGYARLPSRVRHRRQVTLRRDLEVVIVEDMLSGRGQAGVEVRWHLALPVQRGVPDGARARCTALERELGPLDLDQALTIGEDGRCLIVRSMPDTMEVSVSEGLFSPGYGRTDTVPLVSFRGLLSFPMIVKTFFIRLTGNR